jgi:hypothetical protein
MHHDSSGASHQSRGPAVSELFAHFPGRVAVPHDDLGLGTMKTWQYEAVDDTPWALEALYDSGSRYLLSVKSVRSSAGLSPRGLPLENDTIQISKFLQRADIIANPERYASGHHPDRRDHLDRYQAAQQAVHDALPETVTVPCDGVPRTGSRITALGCCVARLTWDDTTMWCTGQPEIVARLALRTATLDDFRTPNAE